MLLDDKYYFCLEKHEPLFHKTYFPWTYQSFCYKHFSSLVGGRAHPCRHACQVLRSALYGLFLEDAAVASAILPGKKGEAEFYGGANNLFLR